MGRKSIKENKNIYQITREEIGLTRAEASELTGLSDDKIEKIENQGVVPYPDEVILMAKGYKEPSLCNHYCATECPIGKKYICEVSVDDLRRTAIEIMISLDSLQEKRNSLMKISVDNTVRDEEIEPFVDIQMELKRISTLAQTAELWTEGMLAAGKINKEIYDAAIKKRT